jgi:hypothetical protein
MLKTRLVQLFGILAAIGLAAVCVAGLYPAEPPVFLPSSLSAEPGGTLTLWGMGFSRAHPDFSMVIGGVRAHVLSVGRIRISARVPANATDGSVQIHGFSQDMTLDGLRTGKPAYVPKADPAFKPLLGKKDDRDKKGARIFINLMNLTFDTDVSAAQAEQEIQSWGGEVLSYRQLDNSYRVGFPKIRTYDEFKKVSEIASRASQLTSLTFERIAERAQ